MTDVYRHDPLPDRVGELIQLGLDREAAALGAATAAHRYLDPNPSQLHRARRPRVSVRETFNAAVVAGAAGAPSDLDFAPAAYSTR
jgi:hypothetical protein